MQQNPTPATKKPVHYIAAGGVVVDALGRVLLIERTIEGKDEVRLPKGHIEPDEPPVLAALREVCEETGYCELRVVADLGWRQVRFDYHDRAVTRDERFYLMELMDDQPRPPQFASEREALFRNRWVASFDEAIRSLTFEAERDAARRAAEAFQAWQQARDGSL